MKLMSIESQVDRSFSSQCVTFFIVAFVVVVGLRLTSVILVFGRARQAHKDDLDNEETHHLHKVTVILELLQHKINIDEPHRLLPTLFATIARYLVIS